MLAVIYSVGILFSLAYIPVKSMYLDLLNGNIEKHAQIFMENVSSFGN
jgi:hypothetical protein